MPTIIVASENPVKIASIREGFERLFPGQSLQLHGMPSPSGVSDQPMSDTETLQGAENRLQYIRQMHPHAHFWSAIEGGIEMVNHHLSAFAWILISNGQQTGRARSASFPLPPQIINLMQQGTELGLATDQVFHEHNSKQKGGAVGSLTNQAISRHDLYAHAVKLALIPFVKPELFKP